MFKFNGESINNSKQKLKKFLDDNMQKIKTISGSIAVVVVLGTSIGLSASKINNTIDLMVETSKVENKISKSQDKLDKMYDNQNNIRITNSVIGEGSQRVYAVDKYNNSSDSELHQDNGFEILSDYVDYVVCDNGKTIRENIPISSKKDFDSDVKKNQEVEIDKFMFNSKKVNYKVIIGFNELSEILKKHNITLTNQPTDLRTERLMSELQKNNQLKSNTSLSNNHKNEFKLG